MIDPVAFLEAARSYNDSAENEETKGYNRLATVDPAYSGAGPARVTFDGETTLSVKPYQWFGTDPPRAGIRVVMLPVSSTYVIAGMLNGGV